MPSELIDVNLAENIEYNAKTAPLPPVPRWIDFFNVFNEWYKVNYEPNGFRKPWTFNYGSMMEKIYLDQQYADALETYNKQYKTHYIPPPPSWNDVYSQQVVAPGGYYEKFNNVMNRSWNSDSDSRAWKADLDNLYVRAITNYNAKYGTNFLCDPEAFGPYAQQNYTLPPETGGGFFNTSLGRVALIASSVVFGPQMAALANSIGAAVVGTTGPLASAVGNIALNTALNGGNIERAVTSYATGFAGSSIGGNIGSFVGSDNVGIAASAAATAAIRGGDVNKAVLNSIVNIGVNSLPTGASKMDDYDTSYDLNSEDYGPVFEDVGFTPDNFQGVEFTPDSFPDTLQPDVNQGDGYYTVPADGGMYIIYDDGTTQFLDSGDNLFTLNDDGTTSQYHVGDNSYTPVEDGSIDWGGFFEGAVSLITTGAAAALKLVNVWNQFGQKKPRPGTATTLPNGGRSVPNKNGTITVTTAGRSVTTPMPTGQPYTFADGTTVINNGDGTVTTINANGQSVVTPVGQAGAGGLSGNTGLLVFGGLALGLVFMGTRK